MKIRLTKKVRYWDIGTEFEVIKEDDHSYFVVDDTSTGLSIHKSDAEPVDVALVIKPVRIRLKHDTIHLLKGEEFSAEKLSNGSYRMRDLRNSSGYIFFSPDVAEEIASDHDILSQVKDDASKWAKKFADMWCKGDRRQSIDESLMLGWFANAIEAGRTAGMETAAAKPEPVKLSTAADFATEAARLVGGNRATEHGDKGTNFHKTAELWNAYLKVRRDMYAPLDGADCATMMVLAKISRIHSGNRLNLDNPLDMAGYSACLGELLAMEEADTADGGFDSFVSPVPVADFRTDGMSFNGSTGKFTVAGGPDNPPFDVTYNAIKDHFYDSNGKPMSIEFYRKWKSRASEFQTVHFAQRSTSPYTDRKPGEIDPIIEFGMWLTTRPVTIKVGASETVYAMNDAITEYKKMKASKLVIDPKPTTPLPVGVTYNADMDNFYGSDKRGMGNDFYFNWRPRAREFPRFSPTVERDRTELEPTYVTSIIDEAIKKFEMTHRAS